MPTKKMSKFDYVRFCLHGVILGGVMAGIVSSLLGFDPTHPREIGGVIGAITVAVGFKLAHWA